MEADVVGTSVPHPPTTITPLQQSANTPIMATATLKDAERFPIPRWNPRTGRTQTYAKWEIAVRELFNAFNVDYATFAKASPTIPSSNHHSFDDQVAAAAALDAWQRINTAIYWHVRASLVLEGPSLLVDMRRITSMVAGRLADGCKLIAWANAFATLASNIACGARATFSYLLLDTKGLSSSRGHRSPLAAFPPPATPHNLVAEGR